MSELYESEDSDNILAILITLMRIYDVQMGLLREQNLEVAEALQRHHEGGKLAMDLPRWEADEEEDVDVK